MGLIMFFNFNISVINIPTIINYHNILESRGDRKFPCTFNFVTEYVTRKRDVIRF
jgi:hypothetical protein